MNAASRIIIVYSVAILSVFTAGIFWAQRYDRVDKSHLVIHDIRRKDQITKSDAQDKISQIKSTRCF